MISQLTFNVIKVLLVSVISAVLSFVIAPFLIKTLVKFKFWKKKVREKTISGEEATIFKALHQERETSVPRGGGVLFLITPLFLTLFFLILSQSSDIWWLKKLNFLSRAETWLPLFTLSSAAFIGFLDDILTVFGKGKYIGGGMSFLRRLFLIILIGVIGAWWFYSKLGWSSIHIPFWGEIELGIFYPLLFILVMLALWAGGIVDGLDGLAGGVFLSMFGAFTVIAFSQGKIDLAALGGVILGTLFAFLWFNIPPARFYMGETGALALTVTLAVFTFLTDSVAVLPIIGGILVMEVGSVILQLLSKKFRKKKIWLATPIHHHFEAKGWPAYQVTMRFWILGIFFAMLGVAIRMAG